MSNVSRLCVPFVCACFGLGVIACDKKADGTAPAGSASTTTATTAKSKTTLKFADAKAAWAAEVDAPGKMKDPLDKKIAALMTKLPKPDADTGRKRTWFAVDGDKCMKLELDTK